MNKQHIAGAQMHAECLQEALHEYFYGIPRKPSKARKKVIEEELLARIRAVLYLIRASGGGELSEDAQQAIREAHAFDGPAEEFDRPLLGTH